MFYCPSLGKPADWMQQYPVIILIIWIIVFSQVSNIEQELSKERESVRGLLMAQLSQKKASDEEKKTSLQKVTLMNNSPL